MTLLLLVILVPLTIFGGWRAYSFWNNPLTPQKAGGPSPVSTRKFTVLVLGADDRPNESGRSDTIMLAFVDLDGGSVKLLSLPRDTYAQIPGHGWDKLNAAYAIGKESLTASTVQGLLGVPVDYTTVVNMDGFADIVDAVGGVDITVDEPMDYDDPYDTPPLHIHFTAGTFHMKGEDALHYVRFRHDAESDWGRMKRQQNFLKALAQAAKQPSNLTKFPSILKSVMAAVRSNLSPSQLTQIATAAKDKISAGSITSGEALTGDDIWSDYGYYLGLHLEEARKIARDLAGITLTPAMESQDQKDLAEYAANLPEPAQVATPEPTTPVETPPAAGTPGTDPAIPGTKPGTTTGAGKTTDGSKTPEQTTKPGDTGQTGSTGTSGTPAGIALLVMDGSNGTQKQLMETLTTHGFVLAAFRATSPVAATTIVSFNAPQAAVEKLQALIPGAQVLHKTPGPGDPQLELMLAPR